MPNSSQGEMDSGNPPSNDIEWLARALFADPADTIVSRDQSRVSQTMTWTALPVRGVPRRLVPTSGRFAAEAFMPAHDAMSTTRRSIGTVVRAAARTGVLRVAPRLCADPTLVFTDPEASVIAAAAQGLGEPVASCAITLGPRRYNRKPVVQLMDASGKTMGFLKVGADPVTSDMVATETAVLQRLRQSAAPPLLVAPVLWHGTWNNHHVACFASVSARRDSHVPADHSRLVDTATAIVDAAGGARHIEFGQSSPVERLRRSAKRDARAAVGELVDSAVDAVGSETISVGQWHGDFSPWNMISTAEATALIDWEFASDAMPIGADLLHHRVMVATHLAGEQVASPLNELLSFGSAIPELHAMSVPAEQHRLHLLLYLFELIQRDVDLQHANRPDTGFGQAAQVAAKAIVTGVSQ